MSDATHAYRSIFLENGWAHQKYFGWTQRPAPPGAKLLTKAKGGFERRLVLIEPPATPDSVLPALRSGVRTLDIIVHDFGAPATKALTVGNKAFAPLAHDRRLLNIATFAIDLRASEDAILAQMSADTRRKLRKAAGAGVTIDVQEKPADDLLARFSAAFDALAQARDLQQFDSDIYRRMYRNGDALLYVARQNDEEIGYLHVYRAGPSAIFMTGVSPAKGNDGANHLLHWEIMRDLKQRGMHWYDLGGVRSFADGDGIARFKKGFGGMPVSLGGEWGFRPSWVGGALALKKLLRDRRA